MRRPSRKQMEERLAAVLPSDARYRVSPFVTSIMNQFARSSLSSLPPEVFDDVYSEALVALTQAASKYDPKHKSKVKVTTLAYPRVRGQIMRAVETQLRRAERAPLSLQSLREEKGFDVATPSPESLWIARNTRTAALCAIARILPLVLTATQEYIVIASYYQGLSDAAIAAELAKGINIVRQQKREALEILRRECLARKITL